MLTFSAPGPGAAQEPSGDTLRAGQLQSMAREALDAGDADRALSLAQRAVDLDPGPTTWLAQQIRVEILEARGETDLASEHLDAYLALPGLFKEHRAWGTEARERLDASLAARAAARRAAQERLQDRRRAGAVLIVSGVVEQGLGAAFLANFHHQGGDPSHSGGWQDLGLALTAVGAGLWVPGLVLAATSAEGGVSRVSAAPWLVVGGGGVVLGVAGRW